MSDASTNNQPETHSPAGEKDASVNRLSTLGDRVRSLRLPERQTQGGTLLVTLSLLCLALAGSTGYLAWRALTTPAGSQPDPEAKLPGSLEGKKPAPVESGAVVHTGKGNVTPISIIQVSPKVGGMVYELNFQEGMKITQEMVDNKFVLAKLETTDYQADYDRAAASARSAKARWDELHKYRDDEISQAKAELDDAKYQRDQLYSAWKRSYTLRSTNSIAPHEYEQAESGYKSQEARVKKLDLSHKLMREGPRDQRIASAKADWDQAEAEKTKAKWKLDNCVVYAPTTGTILSKKTEKWNLVNPSAFSNGLSASLCEMADLSEMEVDLAIAERDISKIFAGQECLVRAEAFSDRDYKGVVSRIMPTADQGRSAVPVRVKITIPVEEAGVYLRPQMGAIVTFYAKKK